MITQSNSKIFTNTVFGQGTNATSNDLVEKDRSTQETYLESSAYSNLGTQLPRVPSNQRVAKGS
jgi:hypothetical protein